MRRLVAKARGFLEAKNLETMVRETTARASKLYGAARAVSLGRFGRVPQAAFAAAGIGIVALVGMTLFAEEMPRQDSAETERGADTNTHGVNSPGTLAGMFGPPSLSGPDRFAGPTPANRLLSMPLMPADLSFGLAQDDRQEPDLSGLSDLPTDMIWDRLKEEENKEPGKERVRPSFAAFSEAREQLPWDAVEPVPFAPIAPVKQARLVSSPAQGGSSPLKTAASAGKVGDWLKTKVTEIKGADRSRPLYHFELWLEPPAPMKQQLAGVSYEFSTPAVRPQSQASSNSGTGFRISAGGLACPDEIVVTIRFVDGRSERVSIDGCELLS